MDLLIKILEHVVSGAQLKDILSVFADAIKSKADKKSVYTKDEIEDRLKAATIRVWSGTLEEYNALSEVDSNTMYVIADKEGDVEDKPITNSCLRGVWSGTQEQYDALAVKDDLVLYLISK